MGPITVTPYGDDPATVNSANLNALVSPIVTECNGRLDNTNIAADAGIVDTKLAQITTASKVSGTAITGLASLPSGAGIVPVANLGSGTPSAATALLGDGSWGTFPAAAGMVIQHKYIVTTSAVNCSATAVLDDTIPLDNETTQVLQVKITPSDTDNTLVIRGMVTGTASGNVVAVTCIFNDTTCVAATLFGILNSEAGTIPVSYMTTGSIGTSELTFNLKLGTTSGNTFKVNGVVAGTRIFGGVSSTTLEVMEIKV